MPLTNVDLEYLAMIRDSTESILRAAIGDSLDVAILDAPNQTNVGDSLIWAGEIAYLRRMGLRLRYVSDIRTFDAAKLRKVMPEGVVLLHGGGNFGDLWLGHQNHREDVVASLTDYRIVQLPQSIFFGSPERAEKADAIIGAHSDFRLLLRDPLSIERAKELLPSIDTTFCYDMALGYEPPVQRSPGPRDSVLIIARQDREAVSGLSAVKDGWVPGVTCTSTDWHSEGWLAVKFRLARSAMRLQQRLVRVRRRLKFVPALPQRVDQRLIATLNDINVVGALRLYSTAGVIVVDRLHAHVLALLLGIDHVALDNNYRKIGAVFDEYTGKFSTARYATDTDMARGFVEELTAR
ncbi:polysaccharide pyruvyl transferase family protein [Herbiconiux sp.]|uniref:polysaccharide pyruvyl transferase family protein n=1 Tax=Herbiconiux sp. TaxID=1871186 RepID=UPI0025C28F56|nr:polysaccharide pyruvyl transferase family protein [Herbiconiux sp.]